MGKVKKEKISEILILEALLELREEIKPKKEKKKKENILAPVIDDLKYIGYEKGQVIEIPRANDLNNLADNFRIESIGIEDGRYYTMLNKITTSGKTDKRYKTSKKFFDENTFNKVNTFEKGDIIFLNKRGAIAWEGADYTRVLKKNVFYTVKQMRFDKDLVYVELNETATLLHPNHFIKKEE